MARRRRDDRRCIPGLVRQAFHAAVVNSSRVLTLVDWNVKPSGEVKALWEATGTDLEPDDEDQSDDEDQYDVTVCGTVNRSWDGDIPLFQGLFVHCTCMGDEPGQCRLAPSNVTHTVCPHGAAVLLSVVDQDAEASLARDIARRRSMLVRERAAEEADLPAERARIENGLATLSSSELVACVRAAIETTDGLRHAGALFGPTVMPPPHYLVRCARCDKGFDPELNHDTACRIKHPVACVSTAWECPYRQYDACSRCNRAFNFKGGRSPRGQLGFKCEGPYCFQGAHTSDAAEAVVKAFREEDVAKLIK